MYRVWKLLENGQAFLQGLWKHKMSEPRGQKRELPYRRQLPAEVPKRAKLPTGANGDYRLHRKRLDRMVPLTAARARKDPLVLTLDAKGKSYLLSKYHATYYTAYTQWKRRPGPQGGRWTPSKSGLKPISALVKETIEFFKAEDDVVVLRWQNWTNNAQRWFKQERSRAEVGHGNPYLTDEQLRQLAEMLVSCQVV